MSYNFSDKMKNTFRALKHPNFRYFWIGQCISLIGTWMQNIGQSWLVLTLTDSAFLLGLVGTIQFLPVLLFSLFVGVVIDRFPKKKILLVTQTSFMILAFILSFIVWKGYVKYWHVLILAVLLGITNTIDMPTRQSFMIELAGKEDLTNAIALNSSIFNLARLFGPAVAGIMMGKLGIAVCFFINGLSFIAVITGLLLIKTKPFIRETKKDHNVIADIKEGINYSNKMPVIYTTLAMLAIVNIFLMNFNVTVPVFARDIFGLKEEGFGYLMSAMGLGSFIGAISVASKSKSSTNRKLMSLCALCASFMVFLLGFSGNKYIMEILLLITGYFTITFTANANSTIQLNTDNEHRGRVMSLYTLVFSGTTPIGNFVSGTLTKFAGARIGYIISGLVSFLAVFVLLICRKHRKEKITPILQ